ncbi:VC0807 family protein [Streptomyces sp. NBC_00576]|uniref:VC0807 family protein n=1 Tax=Streptomyces sp. NBC_00576 TaxID=2903665 RepID=UPI002E804390|nr:VC0807 family protein [Streptomyces sp. NBC_00576]WUB71479.1 hypothetical protein OG734_16000 [Streptomyces sp. NBC_00576]
MNDAITAAEGTGKPDASSRSIRSLLAHWGPTIVFNIAGPILLYGYLTDHGWSKAHALMLASLLPLGEISVVYALRRQIDDFGVFTLITMGLTLVSMVAFNSARAILIKDSLLIGIIGLGILLTLVMARPFAYYMGRKFATDGTEASRAWWESLWRYDGFRRTQRTITIVWGVAFVVEAAVRVLLTYMLSTSIMVSVSSIGPFAVLVSLVFWTIRYSRRKQAQAERAQGPVEAPGATGLAGNGTVT